MKTKERLFQKSINSPIGKLNISASEKALRAIDWQDERPRWDIDHYDLVLDSNAVVAEAIRQLDEYFSGLRKQFSVTLEPLGTDFQKKIWSEILLIPFGETLTYGQIASKIGQTGSARAIGGAAGRNPIPIMIPCHRVIGQNKDLTGFSGGLARKSYLLEFESKVIRT